MIDILLSASVPLPERDQRFFSTADNIFIRESIKALLEVILPIGRITCGGHPAITPLLALFIRDGGLDSDRVTIFQSAFFAGKIPREVLDFLDVQITPAVNEDRSASLSAMRKKMVEHRDYKALVIIGGMEGVFEEHEIFVSTHPEAAVLPIASTGAAAKIVYDTGQGQYDKDLATNFTFTTLFRRKLL